MHEHRDYLLSAIALMLLLVLWPTIFRMEGSAQGPYPPPGTSEPSAPQGNFVSYLPLIANRYIPPAAPSYYIMDMNENYFYDLGHILGQHDYNTPGTQDNLVILDYGYPAHDGSTYGVFLTFDDTGTFYKTDFVVESAIKFAQGYYAGTWTDYDSHLRMVIGVNNCCTENTTVFFMNHGDAWGHAVNSIQSGISSVSAQVDVVGGKDIEMAWNRPYKTAQWLDYYMLASNCVPGEDDSVEGCFYNFGNLTISISGTICATDPNDESWNACDVWYVSWGAQKDGKRFARPLPEIYVRYNPAYPQWPWGQNATAWKDLSLFSYEQMGAGKMYFVGTLTQRARCGDGCNQGNNYPSEGYQLLYQALASDPATAMWSRWSTDIGLQPLP